MALWTWWPGDALPDLGCLTDFSGTLEPGFDKVADITGLDRRAIEARLGDGNRCYVGWLGGTAVAYGWVAASSASIGELSVEFQLPAHDLYLWDFKTLPHWRGRGVYPRLLQHILRAEGTIDRRFWIITAPENLASANGVAKAGFRIAGDLAFARDGQPGIVPAADLGAAQTGATLLGVPLLPEAAGGVSPCWCCIMAAVRDHGAPACWPAWALGGGAHDVSDSPSQSRGVSAPLQD